MNYKNLYLMLVFSFLALAASACSFTGGTPSSDMSVARPELPAKTFKILHVMSYHSPWKWTDDQLLGFKEELSDLNVEYRVYQMDTKNKSSEEWKAQAASEARELIDTWKPDLLYTNDDNAQELVGKYYNNSGIPHVFSGVNATPDTYGYDSSNNVAGILEEVHFIQTANLLKKIDPSIEKISVITDDGPTWPPIIAKMKEEAGQLNGLKIVNWDIVDTYAEYQNKIMSYQNDSDAVLHLGIFTFKGADGANVPIEKVMEWTVNNSNLPDASFWADRVDKGNLLAMTVSGYQQGLAAGKIAFGILAEGRKPSSYDYSSTTKGEPYINIKRANDLGITIDSDILLTSEVVNEYKW